MENVKKYEVKEIGMRKICTGEIWVMYEGLLVEA